MDMALPLAEVRATTEAVDAAIKNSATKGSKKPSHYSWPELVELREQRKLAFEMGLAVHGKNPAIPIVPDRTPFNPMDVEGVVRFRSSIGKQGRIGLIKGDADIRISFGGTCSELGERLNKAGIKHGWTDKNTVQITDSTFVGPHAKLHVTTKAPRPTPAG